MMINKKSILNNLPTGDLSEKEIIFFQGCVHLINSINISYNRLYEMIHSGGENLATEIAMIDVWNIIDHSHRLRCILEKIPGIKRKEPWFQLTLRKLREAEIIRHFIQHYDREIDDLLNEVKPLLGYLSWCKNVDEAKFEIGLVVPGTLRKFKGFKAVNPLGKSVRDKIDLVTFTIGNNSISISDIYYRLIDFVEGLESHIKSKHLNWE